MDKTNIYDTLWQVTQKEKQVNELQLLPKTFYDEVTNFIKSFEAKDLSEEDMNLKKNAIRLLGELQERRKQKILIYVAYKKQMPQPAMQAELDFYKKLSQIVGENKIDFTTAQKPNTFLLKSLQALPEIILPSGKKVGPFEKDQVIEISGNEEDANFLINNTICQKL